ncbi:SIR2 family protein [Flavobacterium sp. DG1-102-2]|uniref:SIR2 family protein n=1 Tax=Flavobacterium sp. DG1-102-2 TaxID=3081663 RepID=UPI00294A35D9|nr:SIR2 family protein [Flavobacterium sp. DG1-102-2]MDV6169512.1 SIR2 family protein [Flavobacterium sp. DG1-102-2]
MPDIIKNKKLTIKVEYYKEGDSIDYGIYTSAIINRGGEIKQYDSANGFIEKDGEQVAIYFLANKAKREFYTNLIQNKYGEIENIVFLTGAGSSVNVGNDNKGLTMAGLWSSLNDEHKDCLDKLIAETGHDSSIHDLEALLSLAGMKNIVEKGTLNTEIDTVKSFIADKCNLELPTAASHREFLRKITLRPQKFPRVKLFTSNYDTLFEQAAREEMLTIMDGFTFSNPREFNGKYYDYDIIETRHNRQDKRDNIISRLFYLFKMHGSLNWEQKSGRVIQSEENSIPVQNRVMIFPQDSKFEHSYEQPYFEMMARFQQALRTENTLLITIGFSFYDKHISSVILESLKQNPSLNLLTFTYPSLLNNDKDSQKELHHIASLQSRVSLIVDSFDDFVSTYPENHAHKRFDLLTELNENLRKLNTDADA